LQDNRVDLLFMPTCLPYLKCFCVFGSTYILPHTWPNTVRGRSKASALLQRAGGNPACIHTTSWCCL